MGLIMALHKITAKDFRDDDDLFHAAQLAAMKNGVILKTDKGTIKVFRSTYKLTLIGERDDSSATLALARKCFT